MPTIDELANEQFSRRPSLLGGGESPAAPAPQKAALLQPKPDPAIAQEAYRAKFGPSEAGVGMQERAASTAQSQAASQEAYRAKFPGQDMSEVSERMGRTRTTVAGEAVAPRNVPLRAATVGGGELMGSIGRAAMSAPGAAVIAGGSAATSAAANTVAANPEYFTKDIGDTGLAANIMQAAQGKPTPDGPVMSGFKMLVGDNPITDLAKHYLGGKPAPAAAPATVADQAGPNGSRYATTVNGNTTTHTLTQRPTEAPAMTPVSAPATIKQAAAPVKQGAKAAKSSSPVAAAADGSPFDPSQPFGGAIQILRPGGDGGFVTSYAIPTANGPMKEVAGPTFEAAAAAVKREPKLAPRMAFGEQGITVDNIPVNEAILAGSLKDIDKYLENYRTAAARNGDPMAAEIEKYKATEGATRLGVAGIQAEASRYGDDTRAGTEREKIAADAFGHYSEQNEDGTKTAVVYSKKTGKPVAEPAGPPSDAALQLLRANAKDPKYIADFDKKFGAGASKRFLGQ